MTVRVKFFTLSPFFKKKRRQIENAESLIFLKRRFQCSLNVVINITASTIFYCFLNFLLSMDNISWNKTQTAVTAFLLHDRPF